MDLFRKTETKSSSRIGKGIQRKRWGFLCWRVQKRQKAWKRIYC